jgi:asparagine synthase (glutamine-hydrolysing)
MCGISGGIGQKNFSQDEILAAIQHRGPDSKGFFQDGNLFLAHTRLSIQDLSDNAKQPMFSEDGRFVIIFNGEIYNHLELRKSIQNEFNFKSTSDTETVLYLFIKYGKEFLSMLNGIFAIVIYDIDKKEIFIARDHFGVKPLYYYNDGKRFLFSSEMKSFLSFDIDKSLDPKALFNYLTFLWAPGDLVPFEHVKKLLPGHYFQFHISDFLNCKPSKYFEIHFNGKYSTLNENDLINILDQKLCEAVKRQMLSDVPVGFFLSGGLDSSLIVAIAKKLFPEKKMDCFTIDVSDWSDSNENFSDDLVYAKKVASLLNVDLHIVKSEFSISDFFDKIIWYLDEPQADSAPLHVFRITELAKTKGIKVLLGGTAGDDIFSGYRRHQALEYEKYFKLMPLSIRKNIRKLLSLMPKNNLLIRRVSKLSENLDKTVVQRMSGYFNWLSTDSVRQLFSYEYRTQLNTFNPNEYFDNLLFRIPEEKNLLNQMLYWELNTFLVDHNLNYTDKMSMANGVETRVPYLDKDLIEFSTTIPPTLKMKNGNSKYILKKLAERYLPKDVIYRSKTGFGAPVRKWITHDLEELINQRITEKNLNEYGIFDYKNVCSLINENKLGNVDASYTIWSILAIDSWLKQFVENKNK